MVAQRNNPTVAALRTRNLRGHRKRLFSLLEEFGGSERFALVYSETLVCTANLKVKK
jgi:hypothetical protein